MIDDTAALIGQMYIELSRIEEEMVVRVLKTILGRPPGKADFAECTRVIDPVYPGKYTLSWKGIVLGTIEKIIPMAMEIQAGEKVRVKFTPHPQWQ